LADAIGGSCVKDRGIDIGFGDAFGGLVLEDRGDVQKYAYNKCLKNTDVEYFDENTSMKILR
jgi:hypothetical protein